MSQEKERKAAGRAHAREERLRTEMAAGAKRKPPASAMVGVIAAVVVCAAVVVGVSVVLRGTAAPGDPLDIKDAPLLLSIDENSAGYDDEIDAALVSYAQVTNYPDLHAGAVRSSDPQVIQGACEALEGVTFAPWSGYEAYRDEKSQMVGGYSSSLKLCDAEGAELAGVSFDGFMTSCEPANSGVYVMLGDTCLVATGDVSGLVSYLDGCVQDASAQLYGTIDGESPDAGASPVWVDPDSEDGRSA